MHARYFRYLFENREDGLIHSGSIYDRLEEETTNYIYIAGDYFHIKAQHVNEANVNAANINANRVDFREQEIPDKVDILVVGGYTDSCIRKLISIVKNHEVDTVVLPYLVPVQRLVLVMNLKDESIVEKETARFLRDPYPYLKELSIPNIYFLYGNPESSLTCPEELKEGLNFELADSETLRIVKEMERYYIPVVQAGYIVENQWIFHFGCYGINIKILFNFTREYYGRLESIYRFCDKESEVYTWQMKKLIKDYRLKFKDVPMTTVVMFSGPLNASADENDSFMVQKEFSVKERCRAWLGDGSCNCEIKCTYTKDFDTMQSHKNKMRKNTRFGMLVLGNTNLNRFLPEVVTRFWGLRERIRAITVPNSGSAEEWNGQVLGFASEKDRIYWICGKQEFTSGDVVKDIALSTSGNRFVGIPQNSGCCFSGYIIPKEEIDDL